MASSPRSGSRRFHGITVNRVAEELRRVCRGLAKRLSLRGTTVTVIAPEGAEALAARSDAEIEAMVELQFALGEGPTRDAFASGRPVLVPDLAASDGRWIGFAPAALASGVTGVYAFPLGLGALRLGVLTCYAASRSALSRDELVHCLASADTATQLLLSNSGEAGVPDPDVQESLHIRSEVYQAQGMLMVELGIGLDDALARLRAIAYAEDVDLNQLAVDLVTGRRPFPERDGPS